MKFAGFHNERKSVVQVWLLNLVPFLGLGTLYATGGKFLPLLATVWAYQFFAWNWSKTFSDKIEMEFHVYIVLSIVGTLVALTHNASLSYRKRMAANSQSRKNISNMAGKVGHHAIEAGDGNDPRPLETLERKVREAEQAIKRKQTYEMSKQAPKPVENSLICEPAQPTVEPAPDVQKSEPEPSIFDTHYTPEQLAELENYSAHTESETPEAPVSFEPVPEPVPEYKPTPAVASIFESRIETPAAPPQPEPAAVLQTEERVQEFVSKLGDTVGTSYQQEPLTKPSFDLSFPAFEQPRFSFDFSSALSSDPMSFSPDSSSTVPSTESKPNVNPQHCPRCGSAKQSDFSFCLRCGISF